MTPAQSTAHVSPWMDEDLAIFRDAVTRFVEAEMVPNEEQWRKQQHVGKDIWRKAGETGLLCTDIAAQYGGVGGDFRHEAVLYEETSRRGISGFGQSVHSICAHYLENHGTEEQKRRFLPRSLPCQAWPQWKAGSPRPFVTSRIARPSARPSRNFRIRNSSWRNSPPRRILRACW